MIYTITKNGQLFREKIYQSQAMSELERIRKQAYIAGWKIDWCGSKNGAKLIVSNGNVYEMTGRP